MHLDLNLNFLTSKLVLCVRCRYLHVRADIYRDMRLYIIFNSDIIIW